MESLSFLATKSNILKKIVLILSITFVLNSFNLVLGSNADQREDLSDIKLNIKAFSSPSLSQMSLDRIGFVKDTERQFSLYFNYTENLYTLKEEKPDLENKQLIASIKYISTLLSTGWDNLYLKTYNNFNDEDQAYAGGYLEGAVTTKRIFDHYNNLKKDTFGEEEIPENVKEYFTKNNDFIEEYIKHYDINDKYDCALVSVQKQFNGLVDGYNAFTTDAKFSISDMQTINAFGDLEDIVQYKNEIDFESKSSSFFKKYYRDNTHCSAFIKVKEDFSDVYFGHNTWFRYSATTRIMKTYNFSFSFNNYLMNLDDKKSSWSSFPSYPGTLASNDDLYVLSQNLIVIETTNPIFNQELFKLLKPETLMTWFRTVLANRISTRGSDWTTYFAKHNSGTYNNQYMILDLNKIDTKKKTIDDEALYIIEQIPNYTEVNDVTEYLRFGFWQSFNVPFSKNIREKSKFIYYENKFPELKSTLNYHTNARANIFRRDAGSVHNILDFKHFMRYNKYQTDELSDKNPSFSISARYDLALDHDLVSCKGAFDAKVGSINDIKNKSPKLSIISGPTSENQTVFEWSKSDICKSTVRNGLPDKYEYDWVTFNILDSDHTKYIKNDTNFLKYLD